MKRKRDIMFVDDEAFWSRPYVNELEKNFTVRYRKSASAALESLLTEPSPAAIVLDMMMPLPTEASASEAESGLSTGVWLLKRIQNIIREQRIPVIVLTNRILSDAVKQIGELNLPDGCVEVRAKVDTPKFYLPHLVEDMLSKRSSGKK